MSNIEFKKYDYVLATKWKDGDTQDQWAVGFYDRVKYGRHCVLDSVGNNFRSGGFRRCIKITKQEGLYLINNKPLINISDLSIYKILKNYREEDES